MTHGPKDIYLSCFQEMGLLRNFEKVQKRFFPVKLFLDVEDDYMSMIPQIQKLLW